VAGGSPLALVVFVASVLVPLLKILSMLLLLLTVHWRSRWAPPAHPAIPAAGSGGAVVDAGYLCGRFAGCPGAAAIPATIKAGPGAIAFGAVVVLTMLSAMHFDPRLIWDVFEDDDER
jgi:paraquat-inducible protein A